MQRSGIRHATDLVFEFFCARIANTDRFGFTESEVARKRGPKPDQRPAKNEKVERNRKAQRWVLKYYIFMLLPFSLQMSKDIFFVNISCENTLDFYTDIFFISAKYHSHPRFSL